MEEEHPVARGRAPAGTLRRSHPNVLPPDGQVPLLTREQEVDICQKIEEAEAKALRKLRNSSRLKKT